MLGYVVILELHQARAHHAVDSLARGVRYQMNVKTRHDPPETCQKAVIHKVRWITPKPPADLSRDPISSTHAGLSSHRLCKGSTPRTESLNPVDNWGLPGIHLIHLFLPHADAGVPQGFPPVPGTGVLPNFVPRWPETR